MKPDSHKQQMQEIKDLMAMLGGHCFVTHQSGKVYGTPGIPDMLVFWPANTGWRFAFVEVKAGKDKLGPAQIAFRTLCELSGTQHIVGRVSDVSDALGLSGKEARNV